MSILTEFNDYLGEAYFTVYLYCIFVFCFCVS